MKPFFSIIVPVYNVAAYLQRAVRSVQDQDWTDWELVLVDDGSTDGSAEVCDCLAAADARIKVVHQPNGGVVSARLHGFEASSGEWILFLDGDDEQWPGLLSELSAMLKRHDPDMVQFGFIMGVEGERFEDHHLDIPEGPHAVADLIAQSKKTPLEVTEMCLWNKVYRRRICQEAFEDVGDVRIKHSEDGLFAFAAYLHARTFYNLWRPGVKYYLREGSAVHKFNADLAVEKVVFVNRIVELFKRSRYRTTELVSKMLAYHSYESVSFMFYRLLQWKGTVRQVLALISEIRKTDLIRQAAPELTNIRRHFMVSLLQHPMFFLVYRSLSKLKRSI